MGVVEDRIAAKGLTLPPPLTPPPGMALPFPWVNVRGDRAFVSGHGPQGEDGSYCPPFGRVGAEVTVEQGAELARRVALGMVASLKRELGELDRVTGWCKVLGMVNAAPGFTETPSVINGFSHLILELFGPEIGRHSRSAVGMAALPAGFAVEIEAEVMIAP